jgi:hypothetical protein
MVKGFIKGEKKKNPPFFFIMFIKEVCIFCKKILIHWLLTKTFGVVLQFLVIMAIEVLIYNI